MKKIFKNTAAAGLAAVFGLTLLTGCFRQHIDPSPRPGATPATRAEPAPAAPKPAPAPAAEEKTPGVIEETYVVDAPEQDVKTETVKEADLGAEPVPAKAEAAAVAAPEAAAPEAAAPVAAEPDAAKADADKAKTDVDRDAAVDEAVKEAEEAEAAPATMGELYYVQVGAFSELENANKVLAGLMDQGYDGSKLVMTDDGQFRVQAGAFTDKESAREALDKLMQTYSGSFILKGTPE